MTHETNDHIETVGNVIRLFPAKARELWVRNALSTSDVSINSSISEWLSDLNRGNLTALGPPLEALQSIDEAKLEKLACNLQQLLECHRQWSLVTKHLARQSVAGGWKDVLLESVYETVPRSLIKNSERLADWVASIGSSDSPPSVIGAIPPLTSKTLQELKLAVDRRKAALYRQRQKRRDAEGPERSVSSSRELLDLSLDYQAAIGQLSAREVWWLLRRFGDGLTLERIAEEESMPLSTFNSHFSKTLEKLRHALRSYRP